MASPLGSHGSVKVNAGNGSSITIQIAEPSGLRSEGLSLSTWGAAFVLSNFLHKILLHPRNAAAGEYGGADIMELGAGTGLVGIAAAALWKRDILLTDLPSILPGLAANINLNQRLLRESGASVSCGSLDWNSPASIRAYETGTIVEPHTSTKPSIILAADTLYDMGHAPALVNTIHTWLAPGPNSKAILCYPLRFAYIEHIQEFWKLMEDQGLVCIQEGREMGREEWNEVPGTEFEWCTWEWKDDSGNG